VGIIGTDAVQPPDARFPLPFRRVHIRFGRPVDPARYQHLGDDRMVLRQITDEVVYEIRSLTGQEYVDAYAARPGAAPEPIAPVVPMRPDEPERPAVVVASAAASTTAPVVVDGGDGVERRSSAAVLTARPLDLDLQLA
jgi:1-acyl-sn-glycerol-3-phosphate acyltransferase